jgi:TrpR-related protein YerC/YecD
MKDMAETVWMTDTARQLADVLIGISDRQTMQNFLRDVMTEKEIIEISSRFEAAKMLRAGKKYAEIIEKTKLSSRTIARISDWMQNGQGGYSVVLQTIGTHHAHMPPARAA